MAVSRGSGESSLYFRVVEGNDAIVLVSADMHLLSADFLGFVRCFLRDTAFMTIPSSESLYSSSYVGANKSYPSSSSPLTSTAIHCSTCSLKWICFLSELGDVTPEVSLEGAKLFCRLIGAKGRVGTSVLARDSIGRRAARFCWAWRAAVACLRSDAALRDCCNMTSDMLLFFKIGFLSMKDADFEMVLLGTSVVGEPVLPLCSGPYSHVTSQSLSLERGVRTRSLCNQWGCKPAATYQFNVSGVTVLSLFLDFIHVLHEAFSSLSEFG